VPNNSFTLDLAHPAARAALERLHAATGAHVSAQLAWLDAWREAYPAWRPWVLALPAGGGELRAVAALAERRYAGIAQIRCLGHTGLDRAPIVSRTPADASELAVALAGRLEARHRPWTLHLRQLPANDPFALALCERLPAAELHEAAGRPVVRVDGLADPGRICSRNLRGAEANARNRIARDGLALAVRWHRRPEAIAERIPEIRAVHRARDLELRGTSKLDHPREGAFYDALLRRHLDRLELLELRLDDDLAAYLLWIRNGPARLVLDNRVAPRWSAYRAGLIANNVALRAAAGDPEVAELDWGSGVQRYKLQSASTVVPHEVLMAWSSPRMRWALGRRPVTALRQLVPG
jgi:hypothetical protein